MLYRANELIAALCARSRNHCFRECLTSWAFSSSCLRSCAAFLMSLLQYTPYRCSVPSSKNLITYSWLCTRSPKRTSIMFLPIFEVTNYSKVCLFLWKFMSSKAFGVESGRVMSTFNDVWHSSQAICCFSFRPNRSFYRWGYTRLATCYVTLKFCLTSSTSKKKQFGIPKFASSSHCSKNSFFILKRDTSHLQTQCPSCSDHFWWNGQAGR